MRRKGVLFKKTLAMLIAIFMLVPSILQILSGVSFAIIYEGDGTQESPYIIDTVEKLQNLQNSTSVSYYKLANDLNLNGITWTPIGSETVPFKGILDGNGKKISNLSASLFGYTDSADIKDLTIENVTAIGGALAESSRDGSIENVKILGNINISGTENVGSMIGISTANIINCKVDGNVTITGGENIGGLVGYSGTNLKASNISDSKVLGTVKINGNATNLGGLVGAIFNTNIESCIAFSEIDGENTNARIGGLVGNAVGDISVTYNYPTVSKQFTLGGDWASLGTQNINIHYLDVDTITWNNFIKNSYSSLKVSNGNVNSIGGLIGLAKYYNVENCYCNINARVDNVSNIGGIIGNCQSCNILKVFVNGTVRTNINIGNARRINRIFRKCGAKCYSNSSRCGTMAWRFSRL